MSRKVYVNVSVRLIINVDEGVIIDNIMTEMDYSFTPNHDHVIDYGAQIEDSEITDWEITESK